MRSGLFRLVTLVALLVLPTAAFAQFGHPFNSPYSGGWGKDHANRLLIDPHWDGKAVTGTINSGGATLNITSTTFDYSDPAAWKVTMKAEGKDAAGKPVTATLAGTLENIGVYYKIFSGTITEGAQKGDFVVTRN
ncbi:MAG TPA: hypothetical protein VL173_08515 [Vicinamibacterales bacterium]|jgi:hypothetical protein|nr:hypothetical protein [Vicinamibacterales bacterium]